MTDADCGVMPEGLVALLRLSAALAVGGDSEWREALRAAGRAAGDQAVEEVILQSYLFVGFPVVLNVLRVHRDDIGAPDPVPDGPIDERREAGERLCRRIYGSAYARLREHVARLHPDLDRWMIEEGYGKTLSRPGLPVIERELCIVSLLAAGGHVPQLRSHLQGALNVGASHAQVEGALDVGLGAATRAGRPHGLDGAAIRAEWVGIQSRVGAS
ncbi:MAG: carboxymuconolactone decarboxylase family protein [Gemmatimonadota bacterium]